MMSYTNLERRYRYSLCDVRPLGEYDISVNTLSWIVWLQDILYNAMNNEIAWSSHRLVACKYLILLARLQDHETSRLRLVIKKL